METLLTDTEENKKVIYVGRVKWFNNRSGYGFIKVISEQKKDEDHLVIDQSCQKSADQSRPGLVTRFIEIITCIRLFYLHQTGTLLIFPPSAFNLWSMDS